MERLFALARVKADMALWQLTTLHVENPYLAFGYTDAQRAKQLARRSQGQLRVVDESSIYSTIPKGLTDPDELIQLVRTLLTA